MRYIILVIFNVLALGIFGAFVFGEGGVLDNLEKQALVYELEAQKTEETVEVYELESKLDELSESDVPSPNLLAQSGQRYDNTVIFRFDEGDEVSSESEFDALIRASEMSRKRIYVLFGISGFLLLFGNILLVSKMRKTA